MRLLPILTLASLLTLNSYAAEPVPRLEKLWETGPVFSCPESVVYDHEKKVLYVSNIGETPKDDPRNGDGSVSVLGLDGKLIKEGYVKGLNDPKGMEIHEGTLWVNDRDAIVEWDTRSDSLRKRHELDDVVFLNDISVGPDGAVFSNDADGHKVLKLVDGEWVVFWRDPEEKRPNGIWVEKDRILLAMNWSGQLIAVDRKSGERSLLLDGIGAGDGIEALGNGDYLITDYNGRVFYLSPKGEGTVLMDSRDDKLTADLEYIPEKKLVIIPRHNNDTVAAYRLVWDD